MNTTLEMAASRRRLRPLRLARDPLTWRSATYLLLHFPLGLLYFIGLVVALSVSASTVIIWVGVVGFAATMILWRAAAMLAMILRKGRRGQKGDHGRRHQKAFHPALPRKTCPER